MRKYQYIIYYNPKDTYSCIKDKYYKNSYCTDSFLKFIIKFILLKRKFGTIEIEYNRI